MRRILAFILSMAALTFLPPSAQAYDFDFSGKFTTDNQVALLEFTVAATSSITIFSSSWGNGVGRYGYVAGEGFDPLVTLWDSAGNFMLEQDDGQKIGSKVLNGVNYTYGKWDVFLTRSLSPGDYIVGILQADNHALGNNLSAGFLRDGNPDYTFDLGAGSKEYFNGFFNRAMLGINEDDPRTGDWEFHILNVASAVQISSVPDASIMFLLGPGLVGLGLLGRRKLKK